MENPDSAWNIDTLLSINDAFVHVNGESVYNSLSRVIKMVSKQLSESKISATDIAELRRVLTSDTRINSGHGHGFVCPSQLFWRIVSVSKEWFSLFDIIATKLKSCVDDMLHDSFVLFVTQLLLDSHTIITHPGFGNTRSYVTCGPIINLLASSIRDVVRVLQFSFITQSAIDINKTVFDNVVESRSENQASAVSNSPQTETEDTRFVCKIRY